MSSLGLSFFSAEAFFWGAVFVVVVVVAVVLVDVLVIVAEVAHVGEVLCSIPLCCVFWPLLPCSEAARRQRHLLNLSCLHLWMLRLCSA